MLIGALHPTGRVLLSNAEKDYILGGIEQNIRSDGRKCDVWRSLSLEMDPVPQAAGSSRVRIGGTDVLVSVKGDISVPSRSKPDEGVIICTVDSSAVFSLNSIHSSDERLVRERNEELGFILRSVLIDSGALNPKLFSIFEGRHCWTIYIDVLVLDYDGNILDAMLIAASLALSRMRLPVVRVEESSESSEVTLSEDIDTSRIILLDSLPTTVTVAQVGHGFVIDPSYKEELCSSAALCISFSSSDEVSSIMKLGEGMIDPGLVSEFINIASQAAFSLRSLLTNR